MKQKKKTGDPLGPGAATDAKKLTGNAKAREAALKIKAVLASSGSGEDTAEDTKQQKTKKKKATRQTKAKKMKRMRICCCHVCGCEIGPFHTILVPIDYNPRSGTTVRGPRA